MSGEIDCRSKVGLTIGLIDSIMSISGCLIDRLRSLDFDCDEHKLIDGALSDLRSDANLKYLLGRLKDA